MKTFEIETTVFYVSNVVHFSPHRYNRAQLNFIEFIEVKEFRQFSLKKTSQRKIEFSVGHVSHFLN